MTFMALFDYSSCNDKNGSYAHFVFSTEGYRTVLWRNKESDVIERNTTKNYIKKRIKYTNIGIYSHIHFW